MTSTSTSALCPSRKSPKANLCAWGTQLRMKDMPVKELSIGVGVEASEHDPRLWGAKRKLPTNAGSRRHVIQMNSLSRNRPRRVDSTGQDDLGQIKRHRDVIQNLSGEDQVSALTLRQICNGRQPTHVPSQNEPPS